MRNFGVNELRESFLNFFQGKDHLKLQSYSLIPKNDKSLLLINAGMAPLKAYFTGLQAPPSKRVTTCQKCIRTGDINNVGITSRHATFFEMLGNFSFGDYFKEEIIPWAWEYVTMVLQIPKDKLYVTIYLDDDEAQEIWTSKTDIDPKRIFRLGKEDNFWEHGIGPCGPCSEIHYDRGEEKITTTEDFIRAGEEDRVVEFWNLVFTQFEKDEEGNYNRLKNPNIDTGMGLERLATIMQGVNSIFEIDTVKNILNKVLEVSGTEYGKSRESDISLRIITDHIRSITFMISDGVLPSNEGRGYVLRRLLRRASRHGKLLGINKTFLFELCNSVIENFYTAYPELKEKEVYIKKVIKLEEERFIETIDSGMSILVSYIEEMADNNITILSGDKAFKLYDTYGFPLELTEEIIKEKGYTIDIDSFNKEMNLQRERARAAREESTYMGTNVSILDKIPSNIVSEFIGYDKIEGSGKVVLIISQDEIKETATVGQKIILLTDKTPFYAEMGGQIADQGIIFNDNFKAEVEDVKKNIGGNILHFIKVIQGEIVIGDLVNMKVNKERRLSICKNHTATHMLHAALRDVLGEHVHQSGSYVDNCRLRFDFTHFAPMTEDELMKVEKIINNKIMEVIQVDTNVMSLEEAKELNAMALFDEKYEDSVRVVSIDKFSSELCGGTHVKNIGSIGTFKIIAESGVASGIRRIEAVTGINALEYIEDKYKKLQEVCCLLKCSERDIINRIKQQSIEAKSKEKEVEQLKLKIACGVEDEILRNTVEIKGIKVTLGTLENIDSNNLRMLADKIRDKLVEGVVLLGSKYEDKLSFVAMATKDAVQKGVHCGKLIKEVAQIAAGSGGGRPDMAQAGGKDINKLNEAVNSTIKIMEKLVK